MAGALSLDAAVQAAAAEDQGAAAEVSAQPSPTPVDSSAAQPAAQAPVDTGAGAAQPSQATGGQQAAQAQAQQAWALREELKGLGVDITQFQDDKSAWDFVRGQMLRQSQEFEHQRQQALWQQQQLQQLQAMQQPAAQPQAQAKQPWWNPPEYNAMWEKPFSQDKDGNPVTPADLDPGVRIKLQQYRDWQRESFNNLLRDPIKTLEPGLKDFVAPLVQEAIQQHLGQYQERQFAQGFVQQQRDLLFEKGQNGQPLVDFRGQPVLSPAGQKFVGYIGWLEQSGVRDPRAQQQLASSLLELEALKARAGGQANGQQPAAVPQQAPQDINAAAKLAALQRGNGAGRLPASGGAPPSAATTAAGGNRGTDIRLDLGSKLQRALKDVTIAPAA